MSLCWEERGCWDYSLITSSHLVDCGKEKRILTVMSERFCHIRHQWSSPLEACFATVVLVTRLVTGIVTLQSTAVFEHITSDIGH